MRNEHAQVWRLIPTNVMIRIVRAEDERRWDDGLKSLLSNTDARVRRRAALAAGRIGDERATASLALLLDRDNDDGVREMAAFALGEIESEKDADVLVAALKREGTRAHVQSVAVRARAVEALGKIAAAISKTNEVRARMLGEAIAEALSYEADHRAASADEIVLLGLTAVLRARPANAGPLVAKFLVDRNSRVREDAANTLARLRAKDGVEQLRALLVNDADSIVRANAARALGAAEDKTAFDALLGRALGDTDARVRTSAIRALGSLRDARAADSLLKRGDVLFEADRRAKGTGIAHPVELNELLEIATTLGRVLAGDTDARALAFLRMLREAEKWEAPETEIAFARVAPALYLRERPFVNQPFRAGGGKRSWQNVSAVAQGLGEIASLTDEKDAAATVTIHADAQRVLRVMLNDSTTPALAVPDVLNAIAAFKPADLAALMRAQLTAADVLIRATAANQLAELPPDAETTRALAAALPIALHDEMNDAALAILDALAKQKTEAAFAVIKTTLDAPDYLLRRRAVALLQTTPARANNDDGARIETVLPRNREADYRRALARVGRRVLAFVATDKGAFTIELLPDDAPLTVDNFVELARRGFFNHLTFHRVVPNFVIQGGDPRGDGNGGPGYQIRCEINEVSYARGAVGMALSGKDTGGSQWFVTHSPQPHLDGGYTVFGRVVAGMHVVDQIARGDHMRSIMVKESGRK